MHIFCVKLYYKSRDNNLRTLERSMTIKKKKKIYSYNNHYDQTKVHARECVC